MKFLKNLPKKFYPALAILVLVGIIVGVYFISKKVPSLQLSSEERKLQNYSEKMGKDKFDLSGQVVAVSDQTLMVKATSVSQTISKSKDQEVKLTVEGFAAIFDQNGNTITLSDLKAEDKIDVKGTFSKDNFTAEYISKL